MNNRSSYFKLVILALTASVDIQRAMAGCPFGYGSMDKSVKAPEQDFYENLQAHTIFKGSEDIEISDMKTKLHKPYTRWTPKVEQTQTIQFPYQMFSCPKTLVNTTGDNFYQTDYMNITKQVIAIYEQLPTDVTPSSNPRASFAGCLVRAAGHDFMDFRINADNTTSGGMDGCINFLDGDNAGLQSCIQASGIQTVYSQFCDRLSLADFFVIMSEAMLMRTEPSYTTASLYSGGSYSDSLVKRFRKGRTTNYNCSQTGLMPDAEAGCSSLESIFVNHIYKNGLGNNASGSTNGTAQMQVNQAWAFTTAISGVHTLGGAHLDRSGFFGSQTNYTSKGILNNDFYKNLLLQGWGPNLTVNGNANRNQWQVIDQSTNRDIMMLNSDICLAYNMNPNWQTCAASNPSSLSSCKSYETNGTYILSKTAQCCAWSDSSLLFAPGIVTSGSTQCGSSVASNTTNSYTPCCGTTKSCDSATRPNGPGYNSVVMFAANQSEWLKQFNGAWWIGVENGQNVTKVMMNAGGPGGQKTPKKVKSFVDVFSQATSIGEFFQLIWENPWVLLVLFNFW